MSPVPTRIGRYEIKGRIGGGGMGTLYLARDTNPTTDRLVALKLLRASFDSDELRERFAREAQALAELSHPNIVIIHDSGEFEDAPFIVMEYVRGETLAESIRRRAPTSLGQKLGMLAELCAGLGHAHEAGIIHRDIKPANLMVDVHGRLKILDFGIARLDTGTRVDALTRVNVQIGTPGYMSPEQIEGAEIDSRSDLFSVGAVAYELISYREAFPGATTRQIENKVLTEQPIPLVSAIPGLDPEIADIIASALEKDAGRRCQHAATLGRSFERVRARLEEEERLPRATPAPKPGAERRSRHERAAHAAYERALASYRDGAEGFARRSAMEALAEFPQHAEARKLLGALGHLRDVEPWLPPPGEAPVASTPTPSPRPAAAEQEGAAQTLPQRTVVPGPTVVAQPTVVAAPTMVVPGTVTVEPASAEQPGAVLEPASLVIPGVLEGPPPAGPSVEAAPPTTVPPSKKTTASPNAPKPKPEAKNERRFGLRRMMRAAFRLALVVVVLVAAGTVGGILARRLWPTAVPNEQLTITRPEGGTIVGDGVQCGTRGALCATARPQGTEIVLRAEADEGFAFKAFTGDCAATGGRAVMDAARTCGATFAPAGAPPPGGGTPATEVPAGGAATATEQPAGAGTQPAAAEWVLTVNRPVGGTIVGVGIRCGAWGSDCVIRHPNGFAVTLRAQPDKDYRLAAFTGDCSPAGKTTMTAARTCGATFVKTSAPATPVAAHVLTITRPAGGTVFANGIACGTAGTDCAAPQPGGSSVTLRAQPDATFRFAGFTGDCDQAGTVLMAAARTCGASFVKENAPPSTAISAILTIDRPRNGTLIGHGLMCGVQGTRCMVAQPRGASVQLRAQPAPGFRLSAFTGDCDANGTTVMTAARTCGAIFDKEGAAASTFVLTIRRPANGTVLGTGIECGASGTQCSAPFASGASVQLRAQPNPGFTAGGFTDDCSPSGLVVMTAARTCGATFAPARPGTAGSESSTLLVVVGQTARLEAPVGWQQAKWQVSKDGGNSWTELTNSADYSGVDTTVLRVRRPRFEMHGWQFRAAGASGTASKPITLAVRPPGSGAGN